MMDEAGIAKLAARVLAAINRPAFDAIARVHADTDPISKYLDLEPWISANVRRAVALRLDRAPQNQRVLDLGCGCGYFVHVCNVLGHDAMGVDVVLRPPLYTDVTRALAVPVLGHDITADAPLPAEIAGQQFDVITAYMVCFDHHNHDRAWGSFQWEMFLGAVMARVYRGGVLCLELNRNHTTLRAYTPEVEAVFKRFGATFTGHYPHRPERGGHRVVIKR